MTTALLLIDIQNDYFQGGQLELVGIDQAAQQAAGVLSLFREKGWNVFHVQHVRARATTGPFTAGAHGVEIHASVQPMPGEPVIQKHYANSFRETLLLQKLQEAAVERIVICGAMSHMCIDAATRAGADFGFECVVVHDACATRDLTFNDVTVPAAQVHAAIMAALAFAYAKVVSAAELNELLASE